MEQMSQEDRDKLHEQLSQGVKDAAEREAEKPEPEDVYAAVDGDEKDDEPTGYEAIDGDLDKDDEEDLDSDADEDSGDEDSGTDEDSGDDETQTINRDLYRRAVRAGLSDDEIDAFGPKALEAAIRLQEKGTSKSVENGTEGDETAEESNFLGEFQEIAFEPPEDLDEDAAELFKSQNEKFNAAMKAQHEAMNKMLHEMKGNNEQLQRQQDLRFAKDFDNQVIALGSDWEDTVGKGSMDDLASDSEHANNRAKIFKEVLNLRQSHPEWDVPQLFDVAVGITFPEQKKRSTVNAAKARTEEHRQTRSTAKPSKRKAPSVRNQKAEAKKNLFSRLRKAMGRR